MKYFANADAKYGNAHGRANNVNILCNVLSARANDKALSPANITDCGVSRVHGLAT